MANLSLSYGLSGEKGVKEGRLAVKGDCVVFRARRFGASKSDF